MSLSDAEVLRLARIGVKPFGGVVCLGADIWRPVVERTVAGGVPLDWWPPKQTAAFTAAVRAALAETPAVDPAEKEARDNFDSGIQGWCGAQRISGRCAFCTRLAGHSGDHCGAHGGENPREVDRWPVEPRTDAPTHTGGKPAPPAPIPDRIAPACESLRLYLGTLAYLEHRDSRECAQIRHLLREPSAAIRDRAVAFACGLVLDGEAARRRAEVTRGMVGEGGR